MTADNYFRLLLNGKEVGSTHKEAGEKDVWARTRTFNIGSLLQAGKNVVTVEAENESGPAGLLLRLEMDGKLALVSDKSWTVESAPGVRPFANEIGPASSEPWGSQLTGWPEELHSIPPYLRHWRVPVRRWAILSSGTNQAGSEKTQEVETVNWISGPFLASRPTGKYLLDFGQELTGRVELKATTEGSCRVSTGESVDEAVKKPWTDREFDLGSKPVYSTPTAFRFAVIEVKADDGPSNLSAACDHLYYPVHHDGNFECSDPALNKIWEIGAYTAHLCMQDDIWDAPKRDRLRWMGDLHVSGEVINDAFGDQFLMEQTLRRLREDAEGSSGPKGHVNGIPGYSCAWIGGMADYYRHSGKIDFLRSQRNSLVSLMEYLRGELDDSGRFANRRGQWLFVDWAPEFNGDHPPARVATHLFLIHAIREGAFLLKALGDPKAIAYGKWAMQLEEIALNGFHSRVDGWGKKREANAMAAYVGLGGVREAFILGPDSPAAKDVTSPYYNYYTLCGLSRIGQTQQAMDFVRTFWGGMLAEGATSWWEGYDPNWPKDHFHLHLQADDGTGTFVSLCHGWSAGPTAWLTDWVLGVRPTSGGFNTCTIDPQLGDLGWAKGSVPTPHGILRVEVHRMGGSNQLELIIPKGINVKVPGWSTDIKGPGKFSVMVMTR